MKPYPAWGILLAIALGGCLKDPTGVQPVLPVPSARGLYVLNEGIFGQGNASLSYYDLATLQMTNDLFAAVNGRLLGDVGNQIVSRGKVGYIVVNNSDRIEIIELSTGRSLGAIATGAGTSPRQLAFLNDSLALLTNLYDNSVSILDVQSRAVVQRIPVGNNPEGIALASGKAYVANSGFGVGRTVSVIDVAARQVVRVLAVMDNPAGVAVSPGGCVYVVCGGSYGDFSNPLDDTPARIAVIDPDHDVVRDSILLGGHATSLAIGGDGFGYVPTSERVVKIDTRAHRAVGTFLEGTFYGVAVDEVTGDVYLTDPGSYTQPGKLLVFSAFGEFRAQYTVGLIPGSMAFNRGIP
jgi:YVTN family beta-propeller protein